MINPRNRFLALGLCVTACAGMIAFAGGCGEEEPPPVVMAPPPPPPPPPPAPTVTPIEQLMAEMNIDPRVSLAVSESTPPLRRVIARGPLAEVDDPGGARWAEIEAQLAGRYAGFDAAREPATAGRGRLFELQPERLIAWRGLLRHPKLPSGPETPGSTSSTSPTSWRHLG